MQRTNTAAGDEQWLKPRNRWATSPAASESTGEVSVGRAVSRVGAVCRDHADAHRATICCRTRLHYVPTSFRRAPHRGWFLVSLVFKGV